MPNSAVGGAARRFGQGGDASRSAPDLAQRNMLAPEGGAADDRVVTSWPTWKRRAKATRSSLSSPGSDQQAGSR